MIIIYHLRIVIILIVMGYMVYTIDMLDSALDEYFIEDNYFSINNYTDDLNQDGSYYRDDDEIIVNLNIVMQTTHSSDYNTLAYSNRVIGYGCNITVLSITN